jgi:hypothetical protein
VFIEIVVLERVCLACPANILGEKNLVKSLLIPTLDKVIYYVGTFLQGPTKPQGGENRPFFQHASSSVAPTISMVMLFI